MDIKIDNEIQIGKLGKRDEKLVGWDHIRNRRSPSYVLPPMRARGAGRHKHNVNANTNWLWYLFFGLLVMVSVYFFYFR
jgi:hypothetical protein